MSSSELSSHAAIAKEKLPGAIRRTADLERLGEALQRDERVITMADALFRTGRLERRGLAVVTDRRLICIDKSSATAELLTIALSGITSAEAGTSGGMGDARRGELKIMAGQVATEIARIQPWERAEEIRSAVMDLAAPGPAAVSA